MALPAKMGFNLHNCLTMAKSAIPATIGVAAYQSSTWANYFGPLNYLVAIEGLLAYCILPRARFMQTLLLNVLMICLAAAVNLFAMWCAIKAREHTTPTGEPLSGYNSSASAVLAIWFMFQVYLVNVLRSSRPQFNFPCINYNIYTMIAIAQAGPLYGTMQQARGFTMLLLEACLTGFTLAAGVNLLILPHSNRGIALATSKTYFDALRKVLSEYQDLNDKVNSGSIVDKAEDLKAFTTACTSLRAVDTKLKGDLEFAVRDIGYDYLTGEHLEQCYKQLRDIYLPLLGLQDIAEDLSASRSLHLHQCLTTSSEFSACEALNTSTADSSKNLVHSIMDALNEIQAHLLMKRRHQQDSSKSGDLEKADGGPTTLADHIEALHGFANELVHGTVNDTIGDSTASIKDTEGCSDCRRFVRESQSIQQRVHFVLWHSTKAVIHLLHFTEALSSSGRLQQKRIICPSWAVLFEWVFKMFESPDSMNHDHLSETLESQGLFKMDTINGRNRRHFSAYAHTYLQYIGRRASAIPHALRSPSSLFGFRTMCASMSIGIIAYLKDSQQFFVRERVIWAMIMTMIAMKTTTGQTSFEFVLRTLASIAGTVGAFVCWYIVDGRPAGVIIFLFLYMAGSLYFGVVKPRYTILGIVSAVTPLISVGYALNVEKLGVAYLRASNTPNYAIYQVAPYRLINVIAGLAVAYFWTIFPFPVTETSMIRQNMGACVYLLARYNAIVSETLLTKDRLDLTDTLMKRLRQTRLDTLHQAQGYLVKLKTLAAYTKWQFAFGIELHLTELNDIIRILDRMTTHITVFGYASSLLDLDAAEREEISHHFETLEALVTSLHKVTTILCLVSASITNHLPLPPYLFLADSLEEVSATDSKLHYSIQRLTTQNNMNDKATVVIHAAGKKVLLDLEEMVSKVKLLCGELDFSAHALSSSLEPQVSYESGKMRKD